MHLLFEVCCLCWFNYTDTVEPGEKWIATRWMKDDAQ